MCFIFRIYFRCNGVKVIEIDQELTELETSSQILIIPFYFPHQKCRFSSILYQAVRTHSPVSWCEQFYDDGIQLPFTIKTTPKLFLKIGQD